LYSPITELPWLCRLVSYLTFYVTDMLYRDVPMF
jgi:hypothetical protein